MRISKQKAEVIQDIFNDLEKGLIVDFIDNHISMSNGGHTEIRKLDEDLYSDYSRGPGWSDQAATERSKEEMKTYLGGVHLAYLRDAISHEPPRY